MRKLFALSLLSLLLVSCTAAEINYAKVDSTQLWAGDVGRAVEITVTVNVVHYPPSIYDQREYVTAVVHGDVQILLFCLKNIYPQGTSLTVRGKQLPVSMVQVPNPTGFAEEYYVAICVDDVVAGVNADIEVANNYEI